MRRESSHNRIGLNRIGIFAIALADLVLLTQLFSIFDASQMIPYINPPVKKASQQAPVVQPAIQTLLTWGDGLPEDLDTWIECQNSLQGEGGFSFTVSYHHRDMGWMSLLQDDTGGGTPNIERAASNSRLPHGNVPPNTTCTFNVNLYSAGGGTLPVAGTMVVIWNETGGGFKQIASVPFTLSQVNQELTIATAHWGPDGSLASYTAYPKTRHRVLANAP